VISENKRSEIEIIYQILNACQNGIKKTPLLHKTNLCFPHFINYITFLQKKGIISVSNNNSYDVFKITLKGEKILHNIRTLLNNIES
jgi:predicted transcriptional regulator